MNGLLRILQVASICRVLRKGGSDADLERALSALSIKLNEHHVVGVIKGGLDVNKTLKFFRWAGSQSQSGYKHTATTYNPMIHRLCRAGELDMVQSLVGEMKRDGCIIDTATCKLLLHSFIKAGMFDKALEILDTHSNGMEDQTQTQLNPQLYNSLLLALLKKGQVQMALSIFHTMMKANIHPYVAASNQLLTALRKANMMAEFEKVFSDLRYKGYDFNGWSYNICIHAFGIIGKVGLSEELFEEMRERGCAPDLCTYNCLINARCKAGMVNEALQLFEEMKTGGHDPDAITYGTLIRGLCKVNKVSKALKLFNEMDHSGCNPEIIVYNTLLDGLFKVGRLTDACQFFEKMVQEGVVPNCCSYNILIDGLFKNGRAVAAYKLFDDLKRKRDCVDAVTYSIVISYFCKVGRVEDSLRLLEEMESRGLVSDMVTITSLVIMLQKSGRQDWARQLMKRIGDSSVVPNVIRWTAEMEEAMKTSGKDTKDLSCVSLKKNNIFNALPLRQFVPKKSNGEHENRLPSAYTFVTEKDEEDTVIKPCAPNVSGVLGETNKAAQEDARTKNSVSRNSTAVDSVNNVNTIDQDEDAQKRNKIIHTRKVSMDEANFADWQNTSEKDNDSESSPAFLVSKGRRVHGRGIDSFNLDMFNTYMSVFSQQGKLNIACKLFQNMIEKGCEPGTYTYNMLINGFVRKSYFDEAWGLFHEMGRKTCFADIATYNSVIDGLGKMGEMDMAYAVLEGMLKKGGYLDIVMYNTLINAAGKGGQLDEADNLFRGMTDNGLTPDVVTYNTLIEVHSKAGRVKEAYEFLRMMLDAGCSPNHVTDTILDFLEEQIEKLRYQRASIKRSIKKSS